MIDSIATVLEQCIDQTGLSQVVEHLSEICDAKAEHLRSNWQDQDTARSWERAGKSLSHIASILYKAGH